MKRASNSYPVEAQENKQHTTLELTEPVHDRIELGHS